MNIKKIAAVPIISLALVGGISANASAEGAPVACDYERWYPGADLCGGYQWTISIKEECVWAQTHNYSWWKTDPICQSFVHKNKKSLNKYHVVKRHETLWRIAVRFTGNGHNWKKLAKLNHIKGTTIYVGQKLRVR